MDIQNTLSLIPAWIALVVSAIVGWNQFRERHSRLLMDVTAVVVVQVSEDTSLVLFRLSFVNNSSKGQVVYDIVPIYKIDNVNILDIPLKFDLENQLLNYFPSIEAGLKMPISEYLLPPLDISPHQSQNKWIGYALKFSSPIDDRLPYILQFEAKMFGGKTISECHQFFYPKTIGFYDTHKRHFVPSSHSKAWQLANRIAYSIFAVLFVILVILTWVALHR
jgi:hypothetical protein